MKMRIITIISTLILLVSCGARKTDKRNHEEETKKKEIVEKTDSTKLNEITSVSSDMLKKLSDIGLEIHSDGKPYTLDLGGIKYEGSATVIYKDKSAESNETVVKTIVRDSVVVTYVNEERDEEAKVIDEEKHTERKEYQPYAIVLGLFILFAILSYILIQRFKNRMLW